MSVELVISPILAEKTFATVPVTVRAPQGYAGSVEPSSVKLTLAGPEELLNTIVIDGLSVVADGLNLSTGKHLVKVSGEFPAGVRILRTVPAEVQLTLVAGQ